MEEPSFLTSYRRTKNEAPPYFVNRLPIQCRYEYQMPRDVLQKELRKSLELIQRMAISDSLSSHTGCVNTLDWHEDGRHLLSGSDDHSLIIWDTIQQGAAAPFTIKTEHQGNIFSAKFLHQPDAFVSASGDGLVIRAQLAEGLVQQRPFKCHTGTTYRVLPLVDDAASFISCSEDSTVRLFDVRQEYSNCKERPGCPHSLLVNMEKAVSAMALNPARPFDLAIGCSDSTITLYDRRKMDKALNRIRLQTVKNMPRRITSLQYDRRGSQLLANVLAEKIQLLDLRVGQQLEMGTAKKLQDAKELLPSDAMPIKRLRLRGDWSDTGKRRV
ncbi:hypothetical protein RvY_18828-2 [Ramazzottius varieornatus]|uniref:WD repeat-containing protein 55 homolog n=1 Tax=Ramazzottius varieornatus TaxID=947166 RepID=A0A1D1WA22_RAMVA|nr:hypothetical protein RvY_18828-2 [Ramazzottius varieornatus]